MINNCSSSHYLYLYICNNNQNKCVNLVKKTIAIFTLLIYNKLSNSDGRMTVIGICTSNYDEYNVAARVDTDMLHFIYNNPNI